MKTVAFFNKPPSPGELLSSIFSQPARVLAAVTGGTTEVWADGKQSAAAHMSLYAQCTHNVMELGYSTT